MGRFQKPQDMTGAFSDVAVDPAGFDVDVGRDAGKQQSQQQQADAQRDPGTEIRVSEH